MTPEEKFNKDVWYVLRQIKERSLYTKKGNPISYWVDFDFFDATGSSPSAADEAAILEKLEEWDAIKIQSSYWNMSNKLFRIEIIQPKFDELYRLYEGSFNRAEIKTQTATGRKNQPVIKLKTLELMAKDIGDLDSGSNLVNFLVDCGVGKQLIVYPQTKWRMVYDVLLKLATSENTKDKETLWKILGEAVHPLMHGGDEASAENLLNKFNNYLRFDGGSISFDEEKNTYKVYFVPTKKEQEEIMAEFHEELAGEEKKQQEFLCRSANKEKISLLRKTYQALMGVVEVFCRNLSRLSHEDIVELNKQYLGLDKAVWSLIDELKLGGSFDAYKKYPRPFSNLFSAEKELSGDISWNVIRREMSARFGEIETLYQQVNASEILAEPDKQKQLNDVTLFLSELKEKTKEPEKNEGIKEPLHIVIDEVKKDIGIRGFEEKVVLQKPKNKKIQPRKFPAGLRWEEISIQFLNEHEVIVKANSETLQTTYEAMGFQDEKKKLPNKQWQFLRLLAIKNGEVSWENNQSLPLKQINSIKKQKQLLTEALKAYFQIYDSEPFQDYKTEKAYRIKITLTPEPELKDINEREVYGE
jgi:hypothetical protein